MTKCKVDYFRHQKKIRTNFKITDFTFQRFQVTVQVTKTTVQIIVQVTVQLTDITVHLPVHIFTVHFLLFILLFQALYKLSFWFVEGTASCTV